MWLAAGGLLAAVLWSEREDIEARERERLVQQTHTIEANLARQLIAVDHVLRSIVQDLPRWRSRSDLSQWVSGRLLSFVDAMPGVRAIYLEDPQGKVFASSEPGLLGVDLQARHHSQRAREASEHVLVVGEPIDSVRGGPVVVLVRKAPGPPTEPAGVVSAALDPQDFQILLQSVRYAPDMVTHISHANGQRFAVAGNGAFLRGMNLAEPNSLFFRHRDSGAQETVLLGQLVPADPTLYLMAQRTVQPASLNMDTPLYVAAARDWHMLFADWRQQALLAGLVWLLLGLAVAVLLAGWQKRRLVLQRQERVLQMRWQNVLEATNQGAWDMDCTTGRIDCAQSWVSGLGYSEAEIGNTVQAWISCVHPDDLQHVQREWNDHLQGRTPTYQSMYRIRRKDGRYQWTLDRGRVIERDRAGRPLRMVGAKADMTERQQLQERLDRLVESVPGLLYQLQLNSDGQRFFPYVSARLQEFLGVEPDAVRQTAEPVFARIHPEDLAQVEDAIERSARDAAVWRAEFRVRPPGRGERWLSGQAMPQRLDGGAVLWHGYIHDITESKQRDLKLAETERLLRHLMQQMPIGLAMVDDAGRFYFRNRRFAEYFGYADGEALDMARWWAEVYPDPDYRVRVSARWDADISSACAHGGEIPEREYRVWTRHGTQRAMVIGGIAFEGHFMATFVDQTEQQAHNALLRQMAFVDGLTGIANRRQFDATLQAEWRRCQRAGVPLALVMLDIDHFKAYNDLYGHQLGDECLRLVAGALAQAPGRSHDVVARYGGEEFVCLLPECDLAGARLRAEQLRAAVQALALLHEGSAVAKVVTVSAGVASVLPDPDTAPEALLARADAHLYRAKQAGRNRVDDGETAAEIL